MEMKYYNPSNNFRAPIPREPKPYAPPPRQKAEVIFPQAPVESEKEAEPVCRPESPAPCACEEKKNIGLQLPEQDDLILLGIILVLLANNCNDYLLLLILGYLFISGKHG